MEIYCGRNEKDDKTPLGIRVVSNMVEYDNAVVTVSSNHLSREPVGSAKRFSRRSNKKVDIPQPYLIKKYNEGMGGVDVMDRLLGSYRPRLRRKKWWWNLFSNGLNMAVVAGWLLHCELHKGSDAAMTHIAFWRDVTLSLLQLKQKLTARPGPRVHSET
ncbi:hypothetical protein MRX96_018912 [Rhipicephalus microplus]